MFVSGKELGQRKSYRTAVVPYTILKNDELSNINKLDTYDVLYLFGVDEAHNEITDYGGGVKKNEYDLEAAERELFEETREIFGNIKDKLSPCISVIREPPPNKKIISNGGHGGMSVIFLPIEKEWFLSNKATMLFEDAKNKVTTDKSHHELSELLWINDKKFNQLIHRNYDNYAHTFSRYKIPPLQIISNSPLKGRKMWPKLRAFYDSFYCNDLKNNLIDQWLKFFPS
jgi:hypothetical protein